MSGSDADVRDAITALVKIGTCEVFESLAGLGDLDPAIRALWPSARLCGPAFPVECLPGDKLMASYGVLSAEPGDIVVVSTRGMPHMSYWGGVMSKVAVARGLGGAVIDGCVRDTRVAQEIGFPIFCRGATLKNTTRARVGRHGVPVTVGGQPISKGDIVLGDGDGVIVIPKDMLADIVSTASTRYDKEMADYASIDHDVSSANVLKTATRALKAAGYL